MPALQIVQSCVIFSSKEFIYFLQWWWTDEELVNDTNIIIDIWSHAARYNNVEERHK